MNNQENSSVTILHQKFNLGVESFERKSINDYEIAIDSVDCGGFIGVQVPIQLSYLYWQDISVVTNKTSIRIECKHSNHIRGHSFAYSDIFKSKYMIEDNFILYLTGEGYNNINAKNEIYEHMKLLGVDGYIVNTLDELVKGVKTFI